MPLKVRAHSLRSTREPISTAPFFFLLLSPDATLIPILFQLNSMNASLSDTLTADRVVQNSRRSARNGKRARRRKMRLERPRKTASASPWGDQPLTEVPTTALRHQQARFIHLALALSFLLSPTPVQTKWVVVNILVAPSRCISNQAMVRFTPRTLTRRTTRVVKFISNTNGLGHIPNLKLELTRPADLIRDLTSVLSNACAC